MTSLREPTRMAKSLRADVLRRVETSGRVLGAVPAVHFSGPLDFTVPHAVAAELLAALDAALARIEGLGPGGAVDVDGAVDDLVHLTVRHAPHPPARGSHVAARHRRAARRSRRPRVARPRAQRRDRPRGTCRSSRHDDARTTMTWTARPV